MPDSLDPNEGRVTPAGGQPYGPSDQAMNLDEFKGFSNTYPGSPINNWGDTDGDLEMDEEDFKRYDHNVTESWMRMMPLMRETLSLKTI